MTTTIRIYEDEAFPDYGFPETGGDFELEVPDEVAARWTNARAQWDSAADEIQAAHEALRYRTEPAPYPGRILR